MKKVHVEPLELAYRLINPGCVVLISAAHEGQDNLFSVAWNMPLRRDPPLLAILSGRGHHTFPMIEGSGEFAVNLPDASLVDAVLGCGKTSGRDMPDKFARFGLSRQPARRIGAPLVAEAIANLECRVSRIIDVEGSALILAQVVAAQAAADHFQDGHWTFENGLRLLHHLSGERFCASAEALVGRVPG